MEAQWIIAAEIAAGVDPMLYLGTLSGLVGVIGAAWKWVTGRLDKQQETFERALAALTKECAEASKAERQEFTEALKLMAQERDAMRQELREEAAARREDAQRYILANEKLLSLMNESLRRAHAQSVSPPPPHTTG